MKWLRAHFQLLYCPSSLPKKEPPPQKKILNKRIEKPAPSAPLLPANHDIRVKLNGNDIFNENLCFVAIFDFSLILYRVFVYCFDFTLHKCKLLSIWRMYFSIPSFFFTSYTLFSFLRCYIFPTYYST